MHLRLTAAAALLLLVTGCGDASSSSAVAGDAATTGGSDASSTASDPETTDPTESPDDGETTAPGAELSYGDTATVEIDSYADEPAIAEWTVTEVVPGTDPSDALAPFRLKVTLTAVTDLSKTFLLPSIEFDGLDSAGEDTLFNVEAGCENEVDTATLKPGASVELCIPVLAFEQGDLTAVRYTGGPAYDDRSGQPIVWKP